MALKSKFSQTLAKSVLELLQHRSNFVIPRFQRNYSWDEEKIGALWEDLLYTFGHIFPHQKNYLDAQYLLGPIVLVEDKDPNSYIVIDGQQRLSTLTMLFCVARDIILEDVRETGGQKPEGYHKILEMIENTHMEKHTSWKLRLNDTDKEFFREVQEFEDDKKTQLERIQSAEIKLPSNRLLKYGYVFLHQKITEALQTRFGQDVADTKDPEELRNIRISNFPTLMYFLSHVWENNYVMQVMVSESSSAFQIFETLNERGQTLSKSDLIKNHILNTLPTEELQKNYSDIWNRVFEETIGDDQSDDDFLMESYSSRRGDEDSLCNKYAEYEKMSKRNMYKIIQGMVKKNVKDEDKGKDCKKFIKELECDANFLSKLNDPTSYDDNETRDYIRAMKILKAKFIRAPLLAAYRKYGYREY